MKSTAKMASTGSFHEMRMHGTAGILMRPPKSSAMTVMPSRWREGCARGREGERSERRRNEKGGGEGGEAEVEGKGVGGRGGRPWVDGARGRWMKR